MTRRLAAVAALGWMLGAASAWAAPTRSSPIQVSAAGVVFVVNPDSSSVSRLQFDVMHLGSTTHEVPVGAYPRTLALDATHVFTAGQNDDSVWRLDQADLGNPKHVVLGAACNPYGVAATPAGDRIAVACQGTSKLVVLDAQLNVIASVDLQWPNARAIAISSDGAKAYVTHFLSEEPVDDAHVSVVDLKNNSLLQVFVVPADTTTCENQNAGQGPLNLVNAIAIMPDGAPGDVANQVWVGGTQENNLSKGLFERSSVFKGMPGSTMFPYTFAPFPDGGGSRNTYRPSFHDVIRFGIYKLDATSGQVVGKIDIDEATNGSDIQFSPDGTVAYVVDLMFNSYHIFNTRRGQGEVLPNGSKDVTTLFASPSAYGPGGAAPDHTCVPEALVSVVNERPYRLAPQAQIVTINGVDPTDLMNNPVATGLDFDTAHFMSAGQSRMRAVPDGIGTAPTGIALSPDGETVYVANYLSRNVVQVAAAIPVDAGGKPANLRCSNNIAQTCATTSDCSGGGGFCNHPGGAPCTADADCGTNPPCVQAADCVPVILGPPVGTLLTPDPVPAALLDGKILFNTAARDSSVPNNVGLDQAAPLFDRVQLSCAYNQAKFCSKDFECGFCAGAPGTACMTDADCGGSRCVRTSFCADNPRKSCTGNGNCRDSTCVHEDPGFCTASPATVCKTNADCGAGDTCQLATCSIAVNEPGDVTSTSHDASYVTCTSCHADFGGQDGRTWDFSQFGASLRNTMDLRGRPGFAPGTCSGGPNAGGECFFDAACGDGFFCKPNPTDIPPNVQAADPSCRVANGIVASPSCRWFNPMLTVHWNGDRDEVEDFEHTFRSLMGSGDCDAVEDEIDTCLGALVQRSKFSSSDPVDVYDDLGAPNRNLRGPKTGKLAGLRLSHMADFVYSLTGFVRNPNLPSEASERGRQLFNDPQTQCASCHNGGPGVGKQFFTDKKPNPGFDLTKPARGDDNDPFVRHDVGTANLFDQMDPNAIANQNQTYQNPRIPIPGARTTLGDYVTPVLNDVWNTAPYLHDGSAHTLLDVIRPCDTKRDDCLQPGRGRNLDGQHGVTSMLTPQQLNDLVAFQNTLTLSTIVGTNVRVLSYGALDLSRAVLNFGKLPKHGHAAARARGSFSARGVLRGAPDPIDPRADGVVLTLGTPGGEQMAMLKRTLAMKGKGARSSGRSTMGGGVVTLTLRRGRNGTYRFTAGGKHLDLAALDTGNRDLTVAVEVGKTSFVLNRNLVGKKRVFKLPRRKG